MKKKAVSSMKKRIVFLGSGNMAEALISGLVNSGMTAPVNIVSTDPRAERLGYLKRKFHIGTASDNAAAVRQADIIFIAVKPQQIDALLGDISTAVTPRQLIISIAAGITTRHIERFLPQGTPVIRTMPNTPALLGAGAIAVAPGSCSGVKHIALAKKLLATSGLVVELPEDSINAVTALSGSGPAYVFFLCEAMEQAGVAMGLAPETAGALARQTIFGAGKMLVSMPSAAAELRRNVTSPGGTTAAAIEYMEKNKFAGLVCQAIERAKARAGELAK